MAHKPARAARPERVGAQLLRLTSGNRPLMALLAIASFAGAMLEAGFLVLLTATVMALAAGQPAVGPYFGVQVPVPVALWISAGAVVLRLIMSLSTAAISASLGARVRTLQRQRLSRGYLEATWEVQQAEPVGRLQELLTTFVGRVNQAMVALTQFVTSGLSLIAFMAAGLVIDPLSTVAVLAALGVLGAVLAPVRTRIRRSAADSAKQDVAFATTISESGSLGQEMHTFGVTDRFIDRVDHVIHSSTENARRVQWLHGILAPIYTFLAYAAVVGGVAVLQVLGTGDLATLGAIMLLMLRSLSYGQQLVAVTGQLASFAPSIEQLDATVAGYQAQRAPRGTQVPSAIAPIEFHDVSFAYVPGRTALTGVDLTIAQGEMLGVIGPSGAGKSTIAQLVLGLRPPLSGRLTVAGVDMEDIDRDWWTRRVAFVPQDPVLFTGTVAENLRFFRDGISDDDLRRAAAQANVLSDIQNLPHGFDTHLGERGSQLSGGQRQRLAIARALAGRPQVLVLDEPTSALDGKSEALIRDTLAEVQGQVTIALIAHRMSTLDLCDRLLVIEAGRVTGLDSPAKLRETNSFYRQSLATAGLVVEAP